MGIQKYHSAIVILDFHLEFLLETKKASTQLSTGNVSSYEGCGFNPTYSVTMFLYKKISEIEAQIYSAKRDPVRNAVFRLTVK